MSYERPITIKEAIESIYRKKYLLPAIQREFVWEPEQISRLFDSLMRDYPIGSFLFWFVEKQHSKDFQFYEFIRAYHENDNTHNPKANISGEDDITAILDGQQRLTSLYIGLKGSYAYKLPYRRWDDVYAFPERHLYLNLLGKPKENELEYDFQFLTREEAKSNNDDSFWFKVGDILNIQKESEVNKFLIKNHLLTLEEKKSEFANDTLFKLHAVIHKNEVINYYLEKDEKLDKVLNIFIRVNSGGTQLSYSDLLLSIATAQWKDKDAREEITKFVDEISEIGNDFNFDKDFVLKACLILNDFPEIAFKVDNFNKKNMLTIEKNWDDVSQAIYLAVTLSASLGYNRDTLTSNIALIPIAYYLLKIELPDNFNQSSKYLNDRKKIQKWLICSLLKRVFSGQPDNVLRPIRHVIFKNHSSFPLEAIVDNFKGDVKSLIFSDDEIDNLFYYRYGKAYTFSTLALLYPSLDLRNRFHVDHIFPKSFFTKRKLIKKGISENKIEFYLDNFNYLANLQLLEGTPNQEKSNADFKEWLNKTYPNKNERKDYMEKHYIPDIEIDLNNFDNFIIERKRLMTQKYNNILKLF